MNYWKKLTVLTSIAAFAVSAHAATLSLTDGSKIEGSLEKVHDGVYYFKTGFAGVLEIKQDLVAGLESDDSVSIRTDGGEVFSGAVSTDGSGNVKVTSSSGAVQAGLGSITSAWKAGDRDPIVVAKEAEMAGQLRKWAYTASVDISGSDGNSENLGSMIQFQAKLEGPKDRLLMYTSYKYKETSGVRSEDEQIGGINYTNFFSGKTGWYIREEIERDSFEGIDFRSTTAGGLTYRFIKKDRLHVEGNAGASYRFESYSNGSLDDEDYMGLDFGLMIDWQFADWGKLVTNFKYVPSVDDFGDYIFDHESGIDIPLGTSDAWVMRFGLSNKYNSSVSAGRERMDTTYFTRLILNWD
ncbi:MAG: YdiY family protein [Puniceicoccaceae bacterium]